MVATQFTRSERRALRWMRRRGLGLQPTAAAFDVLAARLDARFRAGLALWPVFAVLYAGWIVTTDSDRSLSLWWGVARTLVPVIGFGLVYTGFTVWCRRADAVVARSLPSRVTRTGAVPASVVLGSIATTALAIVLVLDIAITLLLATRASRGDAVAFGAGVVAVGVIVGVVLRFVLRRPTVAADTSALAVDERLRALDALFAVWPLGWSALALIAPVDLRGVRGSELIVVLAGVASVVGSAVLFSHPAERVRYGLGRFGRRA